LEDVLPDKCSFFTVEKVQAPQARTKLDEVAVYFAPDTAAAHPRRNDDCTDVWLSVLNEVVTATAGYVGTRQIQPNERALIQKMGVTVLIALPGLVFTLRQGQRFPSQRHDDATSSGSLFHRQANQAVFAERCSLGLSHVATRTGQSTPCTWR